MHNVIRKCSFCDGSGVSGSLGDSGPCIKCAGTGTEVLAVLNLRKIERQLEAICKKLEIDIKEE